MKNDSKPLRPLREVDILAGDVESWWGKRFTFIRKTKIKTWKAIFIVAFLAGVVSALIWIVSFS